MTADFLTSAAAFIITIMIFSYVIGDNPMFRVAVHLFVGVAAGYVAAVAWWQVLLPRLLLPLLAGPAPARAILAVPAPARAILAVPFLLSGLLLMKAWPPLARLGAPAMGLLVGVASAVAVGGAIQGTLVPQLASAVDNMGAGRSGNLEGLINSGFVLIGLVASLVYFHFSARLKPDGSLGRPRLIEGVAKIGEVFIAVALGVLFAGVYSAALTALIERLHFMATFAGLG